MPSFSCIHYPSFIFILLILLFHIFLILYIFSSPLSSFCLFFYTLMFLPSISFFSLYCSFSSIQYLPSPLYIFPSSPSSFCLSFILFHFPAIDIFLLSSLFLFFYSKSSLFLFYILPRLFLAFCLFSKLSFSYTQHLFFFLFSLIPLFTLFLFFFIPFPLLQSFVVSL